MTRGGLKGRRRGAAAARIVRVGHLDADPRNVAVLRGLERRPQADFVRPDAVMPGLPLAVKAVRHPAAVEDLVAVVLRLLQGLKGAALVDAPFEVLALHGR